MKQLSPAFTIVSAVCPPANLQESTYKFSQYAIKLPCEQGELLYHSMTGELMLLLEGECAEQNRETLIQHRFLVPEHMDEYAYASQLKKLVTLMQPKRSGIKNFLILTTMDCNARCFYCYEMGRKRTAMNEQTAHDAAAYIARVHGDETVKLRWFGGEPLFNRRAIEIITEDLRKQDIAYVSAMTSNAYLFDEQTVLQAKEDWNLKNVQITLDGTEEVYNRSKAYIYREGNPYQRVLHNIKLLTEAGITVSIRLNMDGENWEDLMRLSEELASRFPDRKNLNVYTALLFSYSQSHAFSSEEEKIACFFKLQQMLKEKGLTKPRFIRNSFRSNYCMADSDECITILPDGHLGKCEHETEKEFVGNVQEGVLDTTTLRAWKEATVDASCQSCVLYPQCRELKRCPKNAQGCSETLRAIKLRNLHERILNTYKNGEAEQIDDGDVEIFREV